MTNIFYQYDINEIGGVETFLYELARLSYNEKRDLTIIYRKGDRNQIRRIEKYCRCVQIDKLDKPIKCKKAFFNYMLADIALFEAEEYIQFIHADFSHPLFLGLNPTPCADKITSYYAVSKYAADAFMRRTGKTDVKYIYNPITVDEEPRIMTLVSAQRLSLEKGGDRIKQLVNALDTANIPYVWHIFAQGDIEIQSPNVFFHKPTLDIRRWLKYADYTVILSDCESFCYGAYESLCLGTPLIITNLPILSELGVNKNNSIILDFDLSNLDVDEIYGRAGTFKFSYTPKDNKAWLKLLPEKTDYIPPKFVVIEAVASYTDVQLDKKIVAGDRYEVTEARAKEIVSAGFAKQIRS